MSSRCPAGIGAGIVAGLLVGCGPSQVVVGPAVECDDPARGFIRLDEVGDERGLDAVDFEFDGELGAGCHFAPGALVGQDLDADGDVDLLFNDLEGHPKLLANDGHGSFTVVEPDAAVAAQLRRPGRPWLAVSAVDLDGDGLPEIGLSGLGGAVFLPNLGGLRFGEPQTIYEQTRYPLTCFQTHAWGDIDGDGDLDLTLPGLDGIPEPGWRPDSTIPDVGTEDLLLRNEGGTFELLQVLDRPGGPWLSLFAHFTDRDGDGDMDLFLGTDRPEVRAHGAAFFRNDGTRDGAPQLVEDAEAIGAESRASAMGGDSYDFNGDGRLDWCVTDVLPHLSCLVSTSAGYVETGLSQGLVTDAQEHPDWNDEEDEWAGWGLSLVDLDADGRMDAVATGGAPPEQGEIYLDSYDYLYPDTVWQGQEDARFVAKSHEMGFADPAHHFGLVAADLAGDGYLDLVIGVADGRPRLWDNPCGFDAWAKVKLRGPEGNREGHGAQVEVEHAGGVQLREVLNLRTVSQSPSELHFGLGESSRITKLSVSWPDGTRTEARHLPVRRTIEVAHPDVL